MASELVERLRALDGSRRPWHGPGAVGQTVGCESWRITATGNQLAVLEEAAAAIEQLTREGDEARTRIAELRKALAAVRTSLHCTKLAPHEYDADHCCYQCGHSTAHEKDIIDAALASALPTKEKP